MDIFPVALKPDRVTGGEQSFNTTIVKFESKTEQRFANQHSEDRTFKLVWELMTKAQYEALRVFHRNQLGAFREWIIEDDRLAATAVTCRFLRDNLPHSLRKGKFADVEIEIKLS